MEPWFSDLQYNDIPGIMIKCICLPSKSYSTMYGAEPQYMYNGLWYNDIPGLMMGMSLTEHKIFLVIMITGLTI